MGVEIALDLHDCWDGIARLAEKLQANGADVPGHAVQHPPRPSDQTVATLLLDARQSAQKFVRHVLAEPVFAKSRAFDREALGAQRCGAIGGRAPVLPQEVESRERRFVQLAKVVI